MMGAVGQDGSVGEGACTNCEDLSLIPREEVN